ncbi:AAA family ATPase [Halalkalibacillus halophilus]|uniref:AAA family ATPase n=1 Tax=Halalkalibacillus halophilus TaxID=392827 RepID=UPI0004134BE5|nr:AAA family ATPase [Halalkalibacillus halophilus]
MKPLKLTLTAFGPYKDQETIDFSNLEGQRLFVISGNTGAGKTSIFDGIAYALYGSASGEDRGESKLLRSDFADDDVNTSAELTFELHGCTYKLFRQQGHVKKGNKTPTGEKIEFMQLKEGKEIPCVDRQSKNDVKEKVEKLIGLTKDQFIQIVMLPQGEFRKLLTSETENKEQILRKIFKTEPFRHMIERLKTKKDDQEKTFENQRNERSLILNEITSKLIENDESPLKIMSQENNKNWKSILSETSKLSDDILIEQEKTENQLQKNKQKINELNDAYNQGKYRNDQFDELNKKETRLKQLEQESHHISELEKKVLLAERATLLKVHETNLKERRKVAQELNLELKSLKEANEEAKNRHDNLLEIYKKEEKREPEREEIKVQVQKLKELIPKVKELNDYEEKIKEQQARDQKVRIKLDEKESELLNESNQRTSLLNEIAVHEKEVEPLKSLQKKLDEKVELAKLIRDYLKYQQESDELEISQIETEKIYVAAKERYDDQLKSWFDGQATILAEHLHTGENCPVCGSLEHPKKASSNHQIPSKSELDQLQGDMNKKFETYKQIQANLKVSKEKVSKQWDQIKPYNLEQENLAEDYKNLCNEGKELRTYVESLEEKEIKLKNLRVKLEETNGKLDEARKVKDEWKEEANKVSTELQILINGKEKLQEDIPEKEHSITYIKDELHNKEETYKQLEEQWKAAQKDLQAAERNYIQVSTNLKNVEEQLIKAEEKKQTEESNWKQVLEESEFRSEEDYQNAKISLEELNEAKQQISEYHSEVQQLTLRIKELKIELKDSQEIDLVSLKEKIQQEENKYEQLLSEYNSLKQKRKEATRLFSKLSEINDNITESEEKVAQITDLYDLVRGQNQLKVSFERYLQIEYLEQIIESANIRLQQLSSGQFHLQRSDRQETRGKQSGLGLDIYDAYTGLARDVKSLSGGEKFNAALSLALGMSDVIQSFQGGVSIEMMFIDEGFGSLDQESLHKAVDTLIDLQKSGRMIGIISHVEELKTAIPAILEVYKNKDGHSKTSFLVK